MDHREREAWRRWLADPTAENAQVWAIAHNRSLDRPDGELLLSELKEVDSDYGTGVLDTLKAAGRTYLYDIPFEQLMVGDFHWLTESHYWIMSEGRPSPKVLRQLTRFYEDHGLELKLGDEEQAHKDYGLAEVNGSRVSRWEHQAKIAEARVGVLEKKIQVLESDLRLARDSVELKKLKAENAQIQNSYNALKEENGRLFRTLQKGSQRE